MAAESKEQPQGPRHGDSQAGEDYLICPRRKLSPFEIGLIGPEQMKTRAEDRDMTAEEMGETDAAIRQIARGLFEKRVIDGHLMFWYGTLSKGEVEEIKKLHWVLYVEKDGLVDITDG